MANFSLSPGSGPGLILVILLLGLAGCQERTPQAAAATTRPPTAVTTVTLQAAPVAITDTYSGRVTAVRSAEIRPQVNGIIIERSFVEGSRVEAGDLLYRIDPAVYEADLASAQSALALAEARAVSARLLAERYTTLVKSAAISRQQVDDADAAWRQAQAQIQVAEAAVQRARINLDYTRIRAPISGVISRSNITEGALVSAQQSAHLASIRQLSPIYVDIRQPAAALLRLKRGPENPSVSLELEDGSLHPETGTLQFTESQVDIDTGTVNLRALFENRDERLLPGLFVRARVVVEQLEAAILAPQQGVSRQPNGNASALVVNASDEVEARVLRLGQAIGDRWLVRDGLATGDRLIVSGLQKVAPGAKVTVQTHDDSAPSAP